MDFDIDLDIDDMDDIDDIDDMDDIDDIDDIANENSDEVKTNIKHREKERRMKRKNLLNKKFDIRCHKAMQINKMEK